MATVEDLEIILERFARSPANLARIELEMFRRTLDQDPVLFPLIERIIQTSGDTTGSKVATLIENPNSLGYMWGDLHFAPTPELRAAVGYQFCVISLDSYRKPQVFASKLEDLGRYYWSFQGLNAQKPSFLDCLKVLAGVFLDPLIIYLRSGIGIEEKLLSILVRYKQRTEWFGLDLTTGAEDKEDNNRLEKRLKKDILRYLFDNGINFSVESQIPAGGGKVDILPILRDWGQLPIEVKVFDGKSRSRQYVSSGLAQAADYARKFNKPSAYYVVFNVKEDSILLIPGSAIGQNIVRTTIQGVAIYSLVCNLGIKLPSSQAAKLERIEVLIPT